MGYLFEGEWDAGAAEAMEASESALKWTFSASLIASGISLGLACTLGVHENATKLHNIIGLCEG